VSKIKRLEINHKQVFMSKLDYIVRDAKKDILDFLKFEENSSLQEEKTLVYIAAISQLLCNESNIILFNFLYDVVLEEYRAIKALENQLTLL